MAPTQTPAQTPAPERVLADRVLALVRDRRINPTSALQLIRAAASVGASWEAVEAVVTELAKGADGIAGTADDLIPPATLATLRVMLGSGVVRELAEWVGDMHASGCVTAKCFPCTGGFKGWWAKVRGAAPRNAA